MEIIIVTEFGMIQSVYTNSGEDVSIVIHSYDETNEDLIEERDADLERIQADPNFKMIW